MLKYELKKVFNKKINLILFLIIVLLAIIFSGLAIKSNNHINKDGSLDNSLFATKNLVKEKNEWQGLLDNTVISEVVESEKELIETYSNNVPDDVYAEKGQSYSDILYLINDIIAGDDEYIHEAILTISSEDIKDIYSLREKNALVISQTYGKTDEQQQFLLGKFNKTKTPFYYEAADAWDTMLLYATTFALIITVLIGLLSAGIFADEFSLGMDAIFFSTKYGRSKAIFNKILSGVILATLVYWGAMGLLTLFSFGVMGISGMNTSYLLGNTYSIYNLTFGQAYLLILLSGYVASLLSSSVAMLFSAWTQSKSVATMVPFILFCVSPFVGRAFSFNTFFQLTPDQLVNLINCLKVPYIYQVGTMVFSQIPFVLLTYFLLSMLLLPLTYIVYRKKSFT